MSEPEALSLTAGSGAAARAIAVLVRPATAAGAGRPAVMFLGGFRSDMTGSKAEALDRWAQETGRALIRFDYSGHGRSGGSFTDGTISRWAEEARAVLEHCVRGPVVLVGSSMGGWISLLLARALAAEGRPAAGLVLIAPAPDFTEDLMFAAMDEQTRARLLSDGFIAQPSDYSDEPYIITRALIEDGRRNRLLTGEIATGCPVHILQGVEDADVPWRHALRLVERLTRDDVVVTLVKDGDHRLSRPQDLERMIKAVADIA